MQCFHKLERVHSYGSLVALSCQQFIASGCLTASLCELQIPLAAKLPYFRLLWVFTYNSWSPKYDYMLKASVRSAADKAPLLLPICIFSGKPQNAKLHSWLIRQGVKIVHHDPIWRGAFAGKLKGKDNAKHSHLYATADMQVSIQSSLASKYSFAQDAEHAGRKHFFNPCRVVWLILQIGTWQRIDIPIIPDLAEHNYCLLTDSDVYFRKHISLQDFGNPLPQVLGMGYEREAIFPPLNAGVMLMNLPSLASSYQSFLHHIMQNEHGLFWPG